MSVDYPIRLVYHILLRKMPYSSYILLILSCFPGLVSSQTDKDENLCARSSCYPATGDLLVGRGDDLFASSTCGLRGPEQYCIISNLKGARDCASCDSRQGVSSYYSHLPKYMVVLFKDKLKTTWWQAENGKQNVYLQLDFEAQFHVTHIVMKFRSYRPAAMLIERSYDYKKTWEVARYYAKECAKSFPDVPTSHSAFRFTGPYCTSEYSNIEPSTGGEVVYKALNIRIDDGKAWTPEVQNLLRMTNIRINFTKLNTLGDDIIDDSPETNKKYFYAVNWLSIRGSCSCYGHAKRCLPLAGASDVEGMVHSVCNCTHNTAGLNCERCKDGYNDRPWSPAFPEDPNECKKCECNGHSDKCRFDRAVWEASGKTSGGVCLECQHNTIGPKCDKCKPLHYQDPSKSISDPDVCKPCDCDPVGSVGRGECQMEDKPSQNLRAGQCICKENVEGTRCDHCKTGFHNLRQDNPSGCESCACDRHGTVGDQCDTNTGKCQCKRNVVGQRCERCKAGFWGLKSFNGCTPCDCDPGGAYDNFCEPETGQCRCRPGIEGRRCDRVIPGYYFALSDNLKYEAEKARPIGVATVKLLERPAGTKVVWTDVGSLKISEPNGVEFDITNVPMTGNYKILMRFHPQTNTIWEEIKVTVSRADGQRTTNGECGNALSSNGNNIIATTQQNQEIKLLEQMVCLEKGAHYYVRIDFKRHQGTVDHVYLDSLVLIPSIESVSVFQGNEGQSRLDDFKRFRCERPNLRASLPRPVVHQVCRKLHFSGSAVIYDGALPCDCDQVGTVKNESGMFYCNDAAGQCPCKPNVIGRRCRKCAPGTYKFGPDGCLPCACDTTGSFDNLCDLVTGQCKCNDLGVGRQCNECPPKEWGFPQCRPCQCNGHAQSCDPVTGVCIDCQHNTAGDHCELCKAGYYGDALKGTSTDCQQCQCPGGSSENQFSPTCKVNTSTSPPTFTCDQCPPGYRGKQCEECSDGYFGNPLISGGKCEKCNCSNNVDFSKEGGCDKRTGECKLCLHNTAGYFCDVCKRGYYGNAKNQTCKPCDCYALGTNDTSSPCDATTGQCPCKPNVIGQSCDRCAPGHWDLVSGEGCKSCDCCAEGATSAQCDEITGTCQCRRDFGGLKCCDCEYGFWGKPPGECKPCDCNPSGSLHAQCDRQTGNCVCKPGVSGKKCNKCQPDTTRDFPECDPCHPCYYSWKNIIDELEKMIKTPGAGLSRRNISVDYKKELDRLDELLRRIQYILGNRTTFPKHVEELEKRIKVAEEKITLLYQRTNKTDKDLGTSEKRSTVAMNEIVKLRAFIDSLKAIINVERANLTNFKDQIPRESINSTLTSFEKSTKALNISENVRKTLEESAEERAKIVKKLPDFNANKNRITSKLTGYMYDFAGLSSLVQRVNVLVCGDPEDGCGGCNSTGCEKCGGNGCDGATTLAEKALATAKQAERALREKEGKANATLGEVIEAEIAVNQSKKEAQIALELAKAVHIKSLNATANLSGLIEEIYKFLNRSNNDPDEVRRVAKFVLGREFNFSEEEIRMLAKRIKDVLKKLTGIDVILEETTRDLSFLEDLKRKAINANLSATQAAAIARKISTDLMEAKTLQETSGEAVKKTRQRIKEVEDILAELEINLNKALNKSVMSVRVTESMKKRLAPLEEKFKENEKLLIIAEMEVKKAVVISNNSKTEAENLKTKFEETKKRYDDRADEQKRFRERVEKVFSDANRVKISLTTKLQSIEGFLKRRSELEDLIEKLKKLEIESKNKFCQVLLYSEFQYKCFPENPPFTETNKPPCEQLKGFE